MRFLADENVPAIVVRRRALLGHDIVSIRDVARGLPDNDVLQRTGRERRVLLTFDLDFGELARSARLPVDAGIILLRIPVPRERDALALADLISGRDDWIGHFSVVQSGRIRMRPLHAPRTGGDIAP